MAPAVTPPDTRTRILEVAFQLFHEQGYHATGISTILREAGVNAGSLYHFFPSKEALLVGVLEYALSAMSCVVMAPAEAATPDPIGRVFALLDWYRSNMNSWGCKMGCPIGNLALEVSDNDPKVRALIDANFRNWADHVSAWLHSDSAALPASVNRRQLAYFVLTVMEGGIMQARAAASIRPFDDSVAQLRTYFDALRSLAALDRSPHIDRIVPSAGTSPLPAQQTNAAADATAARRKSPPRPSKPRTRPSPRPKRR
ncbi:MAG: TetR/AcrR family transcriptional regulator [Phycisphaerales bacterium]|nr:TetR/AcrR family transcriptional regulator [Phycisphaerales bacterium]